MGYSRNVRRILTKWDLFMTVSPRFAVSGLLHIHFTNLRLKLCGVNSEKDILSIQ